MSRPCPAPDLVAVRTVGGVALGPEVKARAKLPAIVTAALAQARRYWRGRATPIAVIFAKGERDGVVTLGLADFAALVGLDVAQLPAPTPLRRERSPQLTLAWPEVA